MKLFNKILHHKQNGGSVTYKILELAFRRKIPRQLLASRSSKITHSARRANSLFSNKEFRYLEIGVAFGLTIEGVNASEKWGVDPNPEFNITKLPKNTNIFKIDSDSFFQNIEGNEIFDFIFLDGLHESKQLLRDLVNSTRHIKQNGWILIDDVIPSDYISSIPDLNKSRNLRTKLGREEKVWHGDCYKILPILLKYFQNFEKYLIIYPDNPQILLRLKTEISHDAQFDLEMLYEEMDKVKYEELFTHENLIKLPLWIEEFLFRQLRNEIY